MAFDDEFEAAEGLMDEVFPPETLTYSPARITGGGRSVSASVIGEQAADLTPEGDEDFDETLWVRVTRDSATGIEDPQMGDLVYRSTTVEPDRRPYVFVGTKSQITHDRWVLEFRRRMRTGRSPRG